MRLICYWSDWKGTYLTWPRNCLLWKGKMSTLPSVWKNLFCRHLEQNDLLWDTICCILINFYTDPNTQTEVRASCDPIHVIAHWPRYLFWPGPKFMKMSFYLIFWPDTKWMDIPFYLLLFWPRCTKASFDMVCHPNKIYLLTYFKSFYKHWPRYLFWPGTKCMDMLRSQWRCCDRRELMRTLDKAGQSKTGWCTWQK